MQRKQSTRKYKANSITSNVPWRLTRVKPLSNYRLEVEFVDGMHGFVEMVNLITSNKAGVFAALKDLDVFDQVFLSHGAVTWPGEIDICPDTMHTEIKKSGVYVVN